MDPDQALTDLRALCQAAIRQADGLAQPGDPSPDAAEVAEAALALDGWLSSGGFIPVAWTQGGYRPDGRQR